MVGWCSLTEFGTYMLGCYSQSSFCEIRHLAFKHRMGGEKIPSSVSLQKDVCTKIFEFSGNNICVLICMKYFLVKLPVGGKLKIL